MKCTHLYLKIVKFHLKMFVKKIIKDFIVKVIDNYQKMVEFL